MSVDAATRPPDDAAPKTRRCVLVVHGVGEQKKSDTLLYIGSPLVKLVEQWTRLFYGRDATEVGRVELSFVPFDVGQGDRPAYAVLDLADQQWFFAEAWWAGSTFHPDLATMLWWSVVHLFDIVWQMTRNAAERARYLIHPKPRAGSSQPAWIWQLVDLVNCVGLAIGYLLAGIAGYLLLVPLMLLAQIPIDAVQNWVLLRVVRPFLTSDAGEFRLYLDDELQAANVRRRVGDAARALLRQARCDELIIVAHSEGCVVSLGMLTDREYNDVARATRKLLTFGAGLNKSWLISPDLDRLFRPLEGDVLWTDFWASYDPVPAGPLDPSPSRLRVAGGRKLSMTDLYRPKGDALAQVGVDKPPIEEQVTNGMNVLTDHGGYFSNEEQVVLRLAAEISCERHTHSLFWPSSHVLFDGIRKRRERVSALTLWRDIAVVFWTVSSIAPWLFGWIHGVGPWAPLSDIPSDSGPPGWLVSALVFVASSLPSFFAPVSDAIGSLLHLPAMVGLGLLLGIGVWAVYRLVQWLWWERWDRTARAAFLRACVASSQGRVSCGAVSPAPPSAVPA